MSTLLEIDKLSAWYGDTRVLNEVDIENVSPMTGVSNESLRERQDMVNDGGYSDKIVSNAPEKIDDTFTVPKVIE